MTEQLTIRQLEARFERMLNFDFPGATYTIFQSTQHNDKVTMGEHMNVYLPEGTTLGTARRNQLAKLVHDHYGPTKSITARRELVTFGGVSARVREVVFEFDETGATTVQATSALRYMSRWVKQDGMLVTFGNLIGNYMGQAWLYRCQNESLAQKFADYCRGRDTDNPNMPAAITDAVRERFGAEGISTSVGFFEEGTGP